MATGVSTKIAKAASAWSFRGECEALPARDMVTTLEYPLKQPTEQLLAPSDHSFVRVSKGHSEPIEEVSANAFVFDDNFAVLKQLVSQGTKVDLFYLDPPYGTGYDFQTRDLRHSYEDAMGQAEYIEFLRRRLILMRECMADEGSIYVHIGHQMLGHLKVLMDEVFGSNQCRNIITRRKCSSKNFTKKQFANTNDFLLFYT
ncbi:MAG: DNA methyltransferase, partial [Phycisphaerales bacterium]